MKSFAPVKLAMAFLASALICGCGTTAGQAPDHLRYHGFKHGESNGSHVGMPPPHFHRFMMNLQAVSGDVDAQKHIIASVCDEKWNRISAEQVKYMVLEMWDADGRLWVVKRCASNIADTDNKEVVMEAFPTNSERKNCKKALAKYIRR